MRPVAEVVDSAKTEDAAAHRIWLVIAKVDGNSTIEAVRAFPKADSANVPIIQILGKTIDGSAVLVNYERYSYGRGRDKFGAWRTVRAVVVR